MKHIAPISGISASRNGLVATSGYDNNVILWEHLKGSPSAIAMGVHDHLVNSCSFSRCGNMVVTASSDYSIRLWSVPDMRLLNIYTTHDDDVLKADFCPKSEKIGACSYDGSLSIHKVDGTFLCKMVGHKGLVESFDWSDDGSKITSVGTDGTIRTWDATSGEMLNLIENKDVDVDAVVYISSNEKIVGDNDGYIKYISDTTSKKVKVHNSSVKRIVLNASQDKFVTTAYDGRMILWQLAPNGHFSKVHETKLPNIAWPRSVAFLDDNQVVVGTFGSTYLTWDIERNEWLNNGISPSVSINSVHVNNGDIYTIGDAGILYKNNDEIGGPRSLCNFVVKYGELLVSGGQSAQIFNAVSGEVLAELDSPINCGVVFEELLAIGTYSGNVYIFNDKDGLSLKKIIKLHQNAIKGLSYNGEYLFSGCADGELSIVDPKTLVEIKKIDGAHGCILNDCSPYNKGFATISRDLHLGLWSLAGMEAKIKSRHVNSIKCIAANEDGNLIATGSYAGTIDIYNVEMKQWVGAINRPTTWGISSIDWNDKKKVFVASSYDGNVYDIAV